MSAKLWSVATANGFNTTLNGSITNTDVTIPLTTAVNLPAGGGILVIDRVNSSGTGTPTVREYISYTGISVNTLTGVTRGIGNSSAQTHSSGAIVEEVLSVTHWLDLLDYLAVNHDASGNNTGFSGSAIATTTEVAAGTDNTKIITPLAASPYADYSMGRQAIINGNFDIWQRGTSITPISSGTVTFLADHWYDAHSTDGGTLPTLTRSRQNLTTGDIPNSVFYTRLATNGAGSSLGVGSGGYLIQKIEHGTRLLCGASKKVTVSYWARSSIANKKFCPTLIQNYGTGGSPTADEPIKGTPITLTSTWTKYTATFTTNTLVGKTFGGNNDDSLQLLLFYAWGTTLGDTYVQTGVTAETYVGSGTMDIAQVQLCSGDAALPFQPKNFYDELNKCMRYYQKSVAYDIAPGTATTNGNVIVGIGAATTGIMYTTVFFKVPMRTTPTFHPYDTDGTIDKVSKGGVGKTPANSSGYNNDKTAFVGTVDATSATFMEFQWTAEAEF